MPMSTPPASWWKTCSTPTPKKALGPFLPSGRRNGVIDGGWGCESIQLRSRRRDHHIGGRIELLVRADIRFPLPTLPWERGRDARPFSKKMRAGRPRSQGGVGRGKASHARRTYVLPPRTRICHRGVCHHVARARRDAGGAASLDGRPPEPVVR